MPGQEVILEPETLRRRHRFRFINRFLTAEEMEGRLRARRHQQQEEVEEQVVVRPVRPRIMLPPAHRNVPIQSRRIAKTRQSKAKGTRGDVVALATNEEIIRTLECPICYSLPIPPIAQCRGGHITCGPCRSKLTHCGLCKKTFSSVRNYPVEAIVNACNFRCPYSDDGCKELVMGEVFSLHKDTCAFRSVICDEIRHEACDFIAVPYSVYWNHLKLVHQIVSKPVFFNDYTFIDLAIPTTASAANRATSIDKACIEISNTDHKFIIRGTYSKGNFRFWVSYVGIQEEASKFKSSIHIGAGFSNREESKISWTMSVRSFRKDVHDLDEVGLVESPYMKKIAKQIENGVYHVQLFCKIEHLRH